MHNHDHPAERRTPAPEDTVVETAGASRFPLIVHKIHQHDGQAHRAQDGPLVGSVLRHSPTPH
eukprot:5203179-Karenia_brevis.AAC.1